MNAFESCANNCVRRSTATSTEPFLILYLQDSFGSGLQLIDYEQLKIENQTLNEKIEERSDELHRLQRKQTQTVQILTHVLEKLSFERKDVEAHRHALQRQNEVVYELRDALTRAKLERESLRQQNSDLKQRQGFIGSDLLVADFEQQKHDLDALQHDVDSAKDNLTQLRQRIEQQKEQERKLQAIAQTRSIRLPSLVR